MVETVQVMARTATRAVVDSRRRSASRATASLRALHSWSLNVKP